MTLLIEVALRSSVVLACGLLLSICLSRRSAALRHRVLAGTLLSAVLVGPCRLILPEWTITVSSHPASSAPTQSQAAARTPAPLSSSSTEIAGHATPSVEPARVTSAALVLGLWASVAILLLGTLIAGLTRISRLSARASRLDETRWRHALTAVAGRYGIARPIALARTDSSDLLATWGILRPEVLLPRHAGDWALDRIHIVLSHELAHIRRHDWFVQLCAEVVRAVLWFNPLTWVLCTRLRRESEQACDDEVLGGGVGARDYASHLLELARRSRRTGFEWSSAIPMAHPSVLERRIAAMLNPQLDRQAPSVSALVTIGIALVLVTLPVAALRARQAPPAPVPQRVDVRTRVAQPATTTVDVKTNVSVPANRPAERRDARRIARVEAVPALQSALTGTIYDATGGVIPGVQVALLDANDNRWTATTNANGRFELGAVRPGRYVLEAVLPGFRNLRQEFELREARDWDRSVTLQLGELSESITIRESRAPATAAAAATGAQPVRVGGNIRVPRKIRDVKPIYPASMRDAGLTGVVPIEAVIGRDGSVTSIRVLSAQVHPDFAIAAVDAVRQWQFTPTLLNGVAVDVVMTVSVTFDLE